MPTYTLAGEYLLLSNKVPDNMINLFSKKNIADRYYEFGGFIRHVLASSIDMFDSIRALATKAINNCDAKHILSMDADVGDLGVSHFVMQMNVTRSGPGRFKKHATEFVSKKVRMALEVNIANVDLKDRIAILVRNDKKGFRNDVCPKAYETVVSDLLTSRTGLNGMISNKSNDGSTTWADFNIKLKALECAKPPILSAMEEEVLYYPTNVNFPAVEFFYKDGDRLIGFQTTRQTDKSKAVKLSAFTEFPASVEFRDNTKVLLYLVPTPSRAKYSTIVFKEKKGNSFVTIDAPVDVCTIMLPESYV